jgi:hypothetical protein
VLPGKNKCKAISLTQFFTVLSIPGSMIVVVFYLVELPSLKALFFSLTAKTIQIDQTIIFLLAATLFSSNHPS